MIEDARYIDIVLPVSNIEFHSPIVENVLGPSPAHPLTKYSKSFDKTIPWCVVVLRDPQKGMDSEVLRISTDKNTPHHKAKAAHGLGDVEWWESVKKHIHENKTCSYAIVYIQVNSYHANIQSVTHIDADGNAIGLETIIN